MDISTKYNDYMAMDIQELKKYIDLATNILKTHEQEELEAIRNKNASALLKTFEHNHSRKLNQASWDFLDIAYLKYEDIDFLELVIGLPEFEAQNKRKHLNQTDDWLENCVKKNMISANFMHYFYNHPVFNPLLKNIIHNNGHINATIAQDVVEFMIEKNLIAINEDYLQKVKATNDVSVSHQIYGYTPYIQYGLKKGLIKASNNEIKDFYELYWPQMSQGFREYVREQYQEVRDITFNKMLSSGHYAGKDDLSEKRKLEYLLYSEPRSFQSTIQTHYLVEQDIISLCKTMRGEISVNASEEQEQRIFTHLASLMRIIKQDYPMKWDVAEDALLTNSFGKFKDGAKKVLLYVKMEHDFNLDSDNDSNNSNNNNNYNHEVSEMTNSPNKIKI